MRLFMPLSLCAGFAIAATLAATLSASGVTGMSAVVHKPKVSVHAKPDFASQEVTSLARDTQVRIDGQEGLWYRVTLAGGGTGYVRVNELRMAATAPVQGDDAGALVTGKAGKGRVSETAGVRGIDESDLRGAGFDGAQLAAMEGHRVTSDVAAAWAGGRGWQATQVAYAAEGQAARGQGTATQAEKRAGTSAAAGLLGRFSSAAQSMLGIADKAASKSEGELLEEELALGPQIAGRILGARPLWSDAAAQQRTNTIGRWVASQTVRPELPWTFGVIDTPEINAFAAPGGYVLVTRGMYELAGSDEELAGVLAHEINHVVHRDHYTVIRQQELQEAGKDLISSQVSTGGGIAGSMARSYVEKHGATIMMTGLDREAEYRSDEVAQIYLARSGLNPLALYAVLQKMAAMGGSASGLAQLYKTHPPLDERLERLDRHGDGALAQYEQRN
ncbi:Zn-dependent protease with chaperone function [Lysobacter niabensis]|uniref:Zn-dependent protease with chaperone function n=1 Tax=Agrilutibacter niabensis TaxID=380628 RepID=A0ABU1VP40_9GAMM|nr:M48 family metalloprotease [Lysobacter niabensis]MDR7099247.1 Zn-dependent protease with chaperone function [Lysobacter niabensis]